MDQKWLNDIIFLETLEAMKKPAMKKSYDSLIGMDGKLNYILCYAKTAVFDAFGKTPIRGDEK